VSRADPRCSGSPVSLTSVAVRMTASAIKAAVPKKGYRQLIEPSAAPSSGPLEMPGPSAAS
jgi:hypothetical protein